MNNVDQVTVTVTTSNPKWALCHDWFFFGTTEFFHVDNFFFSGAHEITFKNLDRDGDIDILHNGIQIYMFCDGYVDTFISAFKTILAFVGGISDDPTDPIWGSHVPYYMEVVNVEFLNETMGYNL